MASASGSSSWQVEPLGKHHNRAAFSCGIDILNRYLKEIARQDARLLVAAPFVAVDQAAPKIAPTCNHPGSRLSPLWLTPLTRTLFDSTAF